MTLVLLAFLAQVQIGPANGSMHAAPVPLETVQPGSGSRAPFINVKAAPYFAAGSVSSPVDDTAAIQAAVTAACAAQKAVYIPGGIYIVSSTITACSSITIRGDGRFTTLRPTMADGSPVINFPPGSQYFKVADIAIFSTLNSANFNAGTATAQQAIGIRVESNIGTSTYSARFSISNVHVFGVKTGYDIQGFISTFDNAWASYNEVGFRGTNLNTADLNLRLENNRQDFAIDSSSAVLLRNVIMEGANTLAVASTLDTVRGVTMLNSYFEGTPTAPRSVPWLTVGGVTTVFQFVMIGGYVSGSGGMATGVYPIKLDNVVGVDINAHFADGSQTRKVLTTANTKDYRLTGDAEFDWFTDESKQLGPAFNYFPNGGFEMWFRGWSSTGTGPTRATIAQETTIVRRGGNALKVLATAGQNFNYEFLALTGPSVVALRGKSIRFGAWLWVPNITEYDESNFTAFPTIVADSFNGSVSVTGGTNGATGRNAWNFVTATITVQVDATRLGVRLEANNSGTNASGNEFVVVDDVTLVEATVPFSRQMNDDLQDSPLVFAKGINGSLVSYDTAAPTSANQTYAVGDTVYNSSPTAGGPQGWICTTGGSPGTWTTFGPVGILQATLSAGTQTATVASGCRAVCTNTSNANAIKCAVSGTTLTFTGTGTDVINYFCF